MLALPCVPVLTSGARESGGTSQTAGTGGRADSIGNRQREARGDTSSPRSILYAAGNTHIPSNPLSAPRRCDFAAPRTSPLRLLSHRAVLYTDGARQRLCARARRRRYIPSPPQREEGVERVAMQVPPEPKNHTRPLPVGLGDALELVLDDADTRTESATMDPVPARMSRGGVMRPSGDARSARRRRPHTFFLMA